MTRAEIYIRSKIDERKTNDTYRSLKPENGLVDFCSNDYLGFARSAEISNAVAQYLKQHTHFNGSTGSRLLSGNTALAEKLEQQIAQFHGAQAGLIFNSGYDANLGLFSSLPRRGDTVITDELIHASIIDGVRLSYANRYTFKHNDLDSLEDKLKQARGNCYVAVESIYSMDGDSAPLTEILALTERYEACLIVDEAHAVGVFNRGLVHQLNLQQRIFATIVTFGKALGAHGAIVLGSELLHNYLVNFARSFIYTTAASFAQLAGVKIAYSFLEQSMAERKKLADNIALFKTHINTQGLIESTSGIQSIIIGGNKQTASAAGLIRDEGFDIRPILSPTVAAGSERLRICLHAFNTDNEIITLANLLNQKTDG
ncbi:8-amino-7-oxononanoate synthase [Mucilaginibacter sp. PPCGB 2223]|uniref:aminotransferase class I/II-fold pyridoxal phosphate-dependent enzyme n=1 Tax=Mucilaginibacter sp. PPCGB 2223 TaxID=1886027 RepID=UPI0008270C83|nr:8-amino-7-oxononanoate synthase [Mucilaginibacter sp. PPCGB 2223]OCX54821.1 8-amino-7-oxononanoate synthase [Mucilaginibacter sp. PPCGB 2223]